MTRRDYCDPSTTNITLYRIPDDQSLPVALCTVSSSLSILGAIAIFWTYYKLPEIRNFVRTLVVTLTLADMFAALGYLLSVFRFYVKSSDVSTCNVCITQSFITTYFSLVSVFMTMVIVIHVSLVVMRRRTDTETYRWFVLIMVISWVIPAIIVIKALSQDKLGTGIPSDGNTGTGPWCWIRVVRKGKIVDGNIRNERRYLTNSTILWMAFTGKAWEMACYIVTTTIYLLVKIKLFLQHKYGDLNEMEPPSPRQEDRCYMLVFLVLYLCRIWGTINFLLSIFMRTEFTVLENLQAFGEPLQGFLKFCLFFVMDETVRNRVFATCCYRQTCEINRKGDVVNARVRYGAMWELRTSNQTNLTDSHVDVMYARMPLSVDVEEELTSSCAKCEKCEERYS